MELGKVLRERERSVSEGQEKKRDGLEEVIIRYKPSHRREGCILTTVLRKRTTAEALKISTKGINQSGRI
jgi:hypothetical protein